MQNFTENTSVRKTSEMMTAVQTGIVRGANMISPDEIRDKGKKKRETVLCVRLPRIDEAFVRRLSGMSDGEVPAAQHRSLLLLRHLPQNGTVENIGDEYLEDSCQSGSGSELIA